MTKTTVTKSFAILSIIAAAVLTGCSTTADYDTAGGVTVPSRLSFSPVTRADDLITWAGAFPNVRVISSYRMVAPVTTDIAASTADLPEEAPEFALNMEPGTVFVEAAGAGTEEPRVLRVIRHAPHQR